MKNKKKYLHLFMALTILLVLALSSCSQETTNQLDTFTVTKGSIRQMVTSTGYIESSQIKNYSLQSAGEVLQAAEKGHVFSKDDVLLEVDNTLTHLTLAQAEANLSISESSLSQAKISLQQALDNNHIAVQLAQENQELAQQSAANALIALQDSRKLADKSNSYARSAVDSAQQAVNIAQVTVEAAQQAASDAANILKEAEEDPLFGDTQIAQYEANLNAAQSNLESALAQSQSAQLQAEAAQESYEQAKTQSSSQTHSAQGAYEQAQINQSITYWSTLGETQNTQKQILMTQQSILQAEQQLELAKINVEMVELDLDQNKVIAPFDGIVVSAPFSEGELASPGMSVISIIDHNFIIKSSIDETDISKLELGQQVTFTLDAFYGQQYTGKITNISPLSENMGGLVSFAIEVTPDQTQDLLFGLSANLTIITQQADDVLIAPVSAVYDIDGKQYVDLQKDEQVERAEIETGIFDYEYIEIKAGLKEGDIIVTSRIEND